MTANIDTIWRYPVKSLAGESLAQAALTNAGLPGDRQFALAHGAGDYDPAAPAWRPKGNFVNLVRTEALAALSPRFDADTGTLEIMQGESSVAAGRVTDPAARAAIEAALTAWLGEAARGQVRLAQASGVAFTDVPSPLVSLINLASVRELGERGGMEIEPRRFRGNLLIDGLRPWGEVDWLGRRARVGGAVLKVVDSITRCAATHVNPTTAARDADVIGALERIYGHVDMGVYAEVDTPGAVAAGDLLDLI